MSKPVPKQSYVKPRQQMIGHGKATETLYHLEELRNSAILECAKEWKAVTKSEGEVWKAAVPQALFDILESYSPDLAETAAIAWLEHRCFKASKADNSSAMAVPELRELAIKVYHRICELDREQFDKELVRNTRYRGDIVRQAAQELVPAAEWRDVVMLIAEGSHYYGYCESWFKEGETTQS